MPDPVRPLVLLGVTGGIAAYKSLELLRELQRAGYDVEVLLTRSAARFVHPRTFAALTGRPTHTTLWPRAGREAISPAEPIEHIALAQRASLLLVAPATARTLARFAHGLAGDLLSTVYLATTAPVVLAPAMNSNMLAHPATQSNLATLRARGHRLVEPAAGLLACGLTGPGRLAELPGILQAVHDTLSPAPQDLAHESLLITAGGTREPLDPVRFLGNRSSGRMGHALAQAALARGARVHLVTASPLSMPEGVTNSRLSVTRVTTSAEMHTAVLNNLSSATAVIGAAAVSDFRPRSVSTEKLSRTGPLTLDLEPTPDILADAARLRRPGTLILAFAAEAPTSTGDLLARARAKLLRKHADAILANDITSAALGFDSDRNALHFLTPSATLDLGESDKLSLSHRILDQLQQMRRSQIVPGPVAELLPAR